MFFQIAEMSGTYRVSGNEGWADGSGTGPSLGSSLAHSKWFCLPLSFCWHCEVPMPIRLLLTSGHLDDISGTMHLTGILINYHLLVSVEWVNCCGVKVPRLCLSALYSHSTHTCFIVSLLYQKHPETFFFAWKNIYNLSQSFILGV